MVNFIDALINGVFISGGMVVGGMAFVFLIIAIGIVKIIKVIEQQDW